MQAFHEDPRDITTEEWLACSYEQNVGCESEDNLGLAVVFSEKFDRDLDVKLR